MHSGAHILGTGSINSHDEIIYCCKVEHPENYATIDKWVKSLDCVSNEVNK